MLLTIKNFSRDNFYVFKTLYKIYLTFLSKSSKFYLIQIIWLGDEKKKKKNLF